LKTWLLTILSLVLAGGLRAQQDSLVLDRTIRGEYLDFRVDNLGNIFLLDKDNQLKKLGPAGDSVAVFNDVRKYGTLFSIDASNPLKILLYYRDFGTILVLDRLLNVRNILDLRTLNIFQVPAIGQSFDNGVWVYDENGASLKRLADDGTLLGQTGDLRLQVEQAPSPGTILDQDRLVYLYDSTQGLLAFDYFGTLKHQLPFTGWQDVQIMGKYILGRRGSTLERYQFSSLDLQEKSLPEVLRGVTRMQVAMDRLYCLRDGHLYIYKL
jgi:hypothetical protein